MKMAIRADGLSKRFGAVQALADLDLEVGAREVARLVVWVLGLDHLPAAGCRARTARRA